MSATADLGGTSHGTTGTGLDSLVEIILADPGLNRKVPVGEIAVGAAAANAMNHMIVESIWETGLANDGFLNAADVRDLAAYIRSNHGSEWAELHGDDEDTGESGFHLVQSDGATTRLFGGLNAVNTVADGIYHLGFAIEGDRLLNEDGNPNASVKAVAYWLGELLEADFAAGTFVNPAQTPYAQATTGTGLDQLVQMITADPGLNRKIATSEITTGARAADAMNRIIVAAIQETGVANDGAIHAADVRDVNTYIWTNHGPQWIELHGDDADSGETAFHLVQNDGATTRLFAKNAVNTVADGIYHLGFEIQGDRLLNEDGNPNATVEQVAFWLDTLLAEDLAGDGLVNLTVDPYAEGTTGTGLDRMVQVITADPGLNRKIATSEITSGARAADTMNGLIVEAIKATGAGNDGRIDALDVRDLNAYLRTQDAAQWIELHGDDEIGLETGFHLVQNDGATTRLYANNAVDAVADGIYHLGFAIQGNRLLNEDGDPNASVESVAFWLDDLLQADLASGVLSNPALLPNPDVIAAAAVFSMDSLTMNVPGDYVQVAHRSPFELAAGTFTLGFTADDVSGAKTLFSKDAKGLGAGGQVTAFVRGGGIEVRLENTTTTVTLKTEPGSIRAGVPYHLAVTFGPAGLRIYLNGELAAARSDVTTGIAQNRETLAIGANISYRNSRSPAWAADFFDGTIEDFTLYSRALNRAEVAFVAHGVVPSPKGPTSGNTGTGLDALVDLIIADPGLNRNVPLSEIAAGAGFADAMNVIIVEAIKETGAANDGKINEADVRDLNAYIRSVYAAEWVELHGDDEDLAETGFHLVQDDGATTRLFGTSSAVNTVADGLYHLGFEIQCDRLLNEDGNANASLESVAFWLDELLEADLASGALANPLVEAYAAGTSGTGLDQLVDMFNADVGLNRNVATSELKAAARAADAMNVLIVEAIQATGVANDGTLNVADVRDLNAYLRANHLAEWTELHGDDECGEETGFHLVQNDGATTRQMAENAVDAVADGIYHLGFEIQCDRLLNEDGNANASLESVAFWLNQLLAEDLAAGSLANSAVNPYATGTTGTGLDVLVGIIAADEGLNYRISTSEIGTGARSADAMNHLIIDAIKETGVANDGQISADDVRALNAQLLAEHADQWATLHGDDEGGLETGFHLVQDDGATTELFNANAVNTVADGLYHLGFPIRCNQFLNEDGNKNASVESVAYWLSRLLAKDLANGSLAQPT